MSDRTFRVVFTTLYAFLASWSMPEQTPMTIFFLLVGTVAAYVIAANIPPFVRNQAALLEANREA